MSKRYFAKSIPVKGGEPKMFLCDSNCVIGEMVIDKNTFEEVIYEEKHKEMEYWGKFCTVVGEMSQDAIWIKSGDEFDEKDFKEIEGMFETKRFLVKGPCGHFH